VDPVYFITHPEVIVEPGVPVTEWTLSIQGRRRAQRMLSQPWCRQIGQIACSAERKSIEVAELMSRHLRMPYTRYSGLGENDRSATGYLPREEFEATADEFFATPDLRVRGWETARAAQARIVRTVDEVLRNAAVHSLAIVAHGGVGALLRCHLKGIPISRAEDQPRQGSYFVFSRSEPRRVTNWQGIDEFPD
jgi:broad specificity phosphatase PhoE